MAKNVLVEPFFRNHYYLIFVNKGNLVHSGSRVSVRLGDARLAHVLVR